MTENTTELTTTDDDLQAEDLTLEDGVRQTDPIEDEPETFPREYVEKLRREAADHRARAKRADDLARELFTTKVAALGRLADPTDLEYSDELLADPEKLSEAVDSLLSRKPHLASRVPRGNVGQGASGASGSINLAGMLRARA